MIIAVGHEAGTGKDTLVMFAIEHIRSKFKNLELIREGFADRLYDLCYSLYSCDGFETRHYYIQNPKAKEVVLPNLGKTPRQLLIGVAEKVREFDPRAWLRPVYLSKPKHVKFITDLRTAEEVEMGNALGAYMLRVQRPGIKQIECSVSAMLRGRDDVWHETLVNNGSLNEWRNQSIDFAERIIIPAIQKILIAGGK